MAEWSNAAVLKTVDLRGSGGSNPSLSAKKNRTPVKGVLFLFEKDRAFSAPGWEFLSHYVRTIIAKRQFSNPSLSAKKNRTPVKGVLFYSG